MSPSLFVCFMWRRYLRALSRANYLNFQGSTDRTDFWCFIAVHLFLFFSLYIVAVAAFLQEATPLVMACGIIALLYGTLSLPALIGISIRRFHDAGFSGWLWGLLALVPIAAAGVPTTLAMLLLAWVRILCFFTIIVICCLPSKEETTTTSAAWSN